jgi:low affinity Fe/Cu permease
MESIISAAITAAVTLVVCLITNISQQEKTRALLEYKIQELTKQVEKHNKVVERVYILERHEELVDEKIKTANHRIDDLEAFHK